VETDPHPAVITPATVDAITNAVIFLPSICNTLPFFFITE
jgi:hypothetical protein